MRRRKHENNIYVINHEIKLSENYLKFLKKLKKEKETQLVLLTY